MQKFRSPHFKTKTSGFSLVEVILASFLFSLIVLAFSGAYWYGNESTALSASRMQGVLFAEEGIEAVKNIRDQDFENLTPGTHGLAVLGGQWALSGTSDMTGMFSRNVTITDVDEYQKDVVVNVGWNQTVQRLGLTSLQTRFTNWERPMAKGELVVNFAGASLNNPGTLLTGITLTNQGTASLTIDTITISWQSVANISDIQIGGQSVWPGAPQPSGTTFDIIDVTIPVGATVPVDLITFAGSVSGDVLSFQFNMLDGEIKDVSFDTSGGPTCSDNIQNGDEAGVDCGGSCPVACPTCSDGVQNGTETGVDCGGSCTACPTCTDGIQNGNETDVDCGGVDCPACPTGPTCNDGIQNGTETGVDCGGICAACPPPPVGDLVPGFSGAVLTNPWKQITGMTLANQGTASLTIDTVQISWQSTSNITEIQIDGQTVWSTTQTSGTTLDITDVTIAASDVVPVDLITFSRKVTGDLLSFHFVMLDGSTKDATFDTSGGATCSDNIQNGDETGVDCGGSCTACPTCTDGVQNGDEGGVDCGGSCPTVCATCDDGIQNQDETGVDCGGSCAACTSCSDGIQNGDETGVDCGGSCPACTTCNDGIQNGDETGVDCGGSCAACATCTDGIQNQDETDVDCGGAICPACPSGPTCTDGIQNGTETGIDCGGSCPTACPTCFDGIQNGYETGVDCGGPSCPTCATCSDGIQNGTETGVDCGGVCSACTPDWVTPVQVGIYNTPDAGPGNGIIVIGDTAYLLTDGDGNDFHVVDVTAHAAPTLTSSIDLGTGSENIVIDGGYAYIASREDSEEMQVVSLATNQQVSSYDKVRKQDGVDVAVIGNVAYLVTKVINNRPEFFSIDISTPTSPSLLGDEDLGASASAVVASGNYAYIVTNADTAEVQVVDVSNPSNPNVVTTLDLPDASDGLSAFLTGSTLYVGQETSIGTNAEFFIIDVSIPTSPTILGSYDVTAGVRGIFVDGARAFLATDDSGAEFQVLNVTTPASPAFLGSLNLAGVANDIFVLNDTAFVATEFRDQELVIIEPN